MADNVQANAGSGGATFATDDVGGVHYPIQKIGYGALDSVTLVSTTNGLPVQPATSATWAATQSGTWNITNVSGTVSLPTGASTAAKQPALGTAGSASTDVLTVQGIASMTALKVDGSAVTQPVSGTVSITANSAVNVAQINGVTVTMGNGVSGTGVQRVTLASDSTGQVALAAGSNTIGALTANQSVNLAQVGGTNIVNGGVAGSVSIGGTVATNVAITANPINLGAQAVSSENTAVTTARQVQLVADLVGKLIVLPYANPEQYESASTSAITDTTSTAVFSAAGAGVRHYVTAVIVTNSHASVGTFVKITDGSGGTVLWQGFAASAGGGYVTSFPTPLRGTANTALHAVCVTTGANVIVSAAGYKGV